MLVDNRMQMEGAPLSLKASEVEGMVFYRLTVNVSMSENLVQTETRVHVKSAQPKVVCQVTSCDGRLGGPLVFFRLGILC